MKPVSLADITYEEGLALLVLRKQAIDSGKLAPLTAEEKAASYQLEAYAEKRAEGWLDKLTKGLSDAGKNFVPAAKNTFNDLKGQYLQFAKNNPELNRILKTTGVGAGLGAATGLISSDKHRLRNMALGGLAGGAIGGGLGTAMSSGGLYDKYIKPGLPESPDVSQSDIDAFHKAERHRLLNRPTTDDLISAGVAGSGAYVTQKARNKLSEGIKAIDPSQMTSNITSELDKLKGPQGEVNERIMRLFTDPSKPVNASRDSIAELLDRVGHKVPGNSALAGLGLKPEINLAAEIRKMPVAKREELFRLAGMFDDSPKGLARVKSLLGDALGSVGKGDLVDKIVSNSSVKPTFRQLLRGAGREGIEKLIPRLGIGGPLLIAGAFGLDTLAGLLNRGYNEVKYQTMRQRLKPYMKEQ